MELEHGAISVAEWSGEKDNADQLINYGTSAMMIAARMTVHDPEVGL